MADPFNTPPPSGTVYSGPTPGAMGGATPGQPGAAAAAPARVAGTAPAVKQGASWFYWIGALSIINTVIALSGGGLHFIFGLGLTDVIAKVGFSGGTGGGAAAFVANLIVVGVFAIFGYFAAQGQKWAFLAGMLVYVGDGVLAMLFGSILSAAFHFWALFRIFQGYKSLD